MVPPQRTSNCSSLLICRPRKDERLSCLSRLTCSGRFAHITGHSSDTGRAQDSERPTFYHCATPLVSPPAKRCDNVFGGICLSVCTHACMYVCMYVIRYLSKALNWKVHFWSASISSGDTGRVRIRRSRGQKTVELKLSKMHSPHRLPTISFLVHFRVDMTANYPSIVSSARVACADATTHCSFDQFCISHKTISLPAAAGPGDEVRHECLVTQFLALPLLAINPGYATAENKCRKVWRNIKAQKNVEDIGNAVL